MKEDPEVVQEEQINGDQGETVEEQGGQEQPAENSAQAGEGEKGGALTQPETCTFSVLQEYLSGGLAAAGRAVSAKSTLPVTQNVLIKEDGGSLMLAGTDLETVIAAWVGGKLDSVGRGFAVPARMLAEYVDNLPPERVDCERQGGQFTLRCGRSRATFSVVDEEEFPPLPEVKGGQVVSVDPEVLRDAIRKTVFAASGEDSRPVLTGVKLELTGKDFVMAAADGFRLAVYEGKLIEPAQEDAGVIVPARALSEVARLAGRQEDPVEVAVSADDGLAEFRMKHVKLAARLLQGTFPNYRQLIPSESKTQVEVSVEEMLRAVRASEVFSRDGSRITRFIATPDSPLLVQSRSPEMGSYEGEVIARVQGEENKIAFDSKYLRDILRVADKDSRLTMEIATPSSPALLKLSSDSGYLRVLMPMFVQW